MDTVYLVSAIVGGGLLALQIILMLVGSDADLDLEADVDVGHGLDAGGAGLVQISLKTVVAFVALFGLGGIAAQSAGWAPLPTVGCALLSGALAFWGLGFAMNQLHRLGSSGTVEIKNTVGCPARVYLRVPGGMKGRGTVTVTVQSRTMQYNAVTEGAELATGALCHVAGIASSNTLIVEPSSTTAS